MPRFIPDEGTGRERLVLIGEAPGRHENAQGRPFVGPSGYRLQDWWRPVGLQRSHFTITNVYPYQPPNNKLHLIPRDDLEHWANQLHDRIAALEDPWLLVPTGNVALRALLGVRPLLTGSDRGDEKKGFITRRRGSIYQYVDRRGRPIKVIPTIHPAATFRTPYWEKRCRLDWQRIAGDAEFRELRLPEREHLIWPSTGDVESFVEDARQRAELLSVDIETPRKLLTETIEKTLKSGKVSRRQKRTKGARRITCVGFSFESNLSLTIPTTLEFWRDEEILEWAWSQVGELLALACDKTLQNGIFDAWWLARSRALAIRRYRYDTNGMHHCLDPADDHDLGYQASIFTREPFWKDEAKFDDELSDASFDPDTFQRYNGKDACVQRELAEGHLVRLADAGMTDFYLQHYAALLPAMIEMGLEGMAVDEPLRRRRLALLKASTIAAQDRLTALAGESLYGPKGRLSAQRLARYFYGAEGPRRTCRHCHKPPERCGCASSVHVYGPDGRCLHCPAISLKLPVQKSRKTRATTTAEVTVRKLMLRYPQKLTEAGPIILAHRRTEKLLEAYDPKLISADGRMRYSFGFAPETGRWSSGKAPDGTGTNIQNRDRETRCSFKPNDGCLFLEADLSQIEDRIVKALTRVPRLIERAQAPPWENDEHKRAAVAIFRIALDAVTSEQRYLAKRARHACVDEATEVLTPRGWQPVIDASVHGSNIAIWDAATKAITFVRPRAWYKDFYQGDMVRLLGPAYDQLVTPDHRVPFLRESRGSRRIDVTAADRLSPTRTTKLPVNGYFGHEGRSTPASVKLVAAIQADAHIYSDRRIEFHLKKPRKIERLLTLLEACEIIARRTDYSDGTTRIRFHCDGAVDLLGVGKRKRLGPWLLNWTADDLDAFLDELRHWDGSLQEGYHHRREVYLTAHKENAEWVQIIAHLRGRQAKIRQGSRAFVVGLNRRQYSRCPQPRFEDYSGFVLCPTVPTGFFVIRRNGHISVTGNTNYDMHGETLSEQLLKEGYTFTAEECQSMIDAIHSADPEIRDRYHFNVRKLVMRDRSLANTWGRVITWPYERLTDELYREAYAWFPQSEPPAIINQWGILPLRALIRGQRLRTKLHFQGHDALTASVPPDEVWTAMAHLHQSLERRRNYGGSLITIWTEFKLGRQLRCECERCRARKGDVVEWKRFPSRDDVEAAVKTLGG